MRALAALRALGNLADATAWRHWLGEAAWQGTG
jgi:hypothetical protein